MPNYSYYYVRAVAEDDGSVKTYKFHKGDPNLLGIQQGVWDTYGRYRLLTRHLRGGLSGSGDVHHPAKALFKVKANPRKRVEVSRLKICRMDRVHHCVGIPL